MELPDLNLPEPNRDWRMGVDIASQNGDMNSLVIATVDVFGVMRIEEVRTWRTTVDMPKPKLLTDGEHEHAH